MPLKKMIVCTLIISGAGSFVHATDDERSVVAQQDIGENSETHSQDVQKADPVDEFIEQRIRKKKRIVRCLMCAICPCCAPCILGYFCCKEKCGEN